MTAMNRMKPLRAVGLFLCEPGGVLKRLPDVFGQPIRVSVLDTGTHRAMRRLFGNKGNRDAHTMQTSATSHDP